jgi:hypothetical protein
VRDVPFARLEEIHVGVGGPLRVAASARVLPAQAPAYSR